MKNGAAVTFISVGSALIGFAAGVAYSKHRVDVERRARIAQVKKNLKVNLESAEAEETPQESPKSEKDMFVDNRKEEDYYEYSHTTKKYNKSEDFDLIDVTFPDDLDEDGNPIHDFKDEDEYDIDDDEGVASIEVIEAMEKDRRTPKQITSEEFLANERDYDQQTWTYYQSDDVIMDFFDRPVELEDEFVGDAKNVLDTMRDDSSIFYRSTMHRTETEVILNKQPFAETIAGLKEARAKRVVERRKLNEYDD